MAEITEREPVVLRNFNLYAKGNLLRFADGIEELERLIDPYVEDQTDRRHNVTKGDTLRSIAYQYYSEIGRAHV